MSEQCKHLSGRDPGNLCERSPAECEYPRCQITPAAPDVTQTDKHSLTVAKQLAGLYPILSRLADPSNNRLGCGLDKLVAEAVGCYSDMVGLTQTYSATVDQAQADAVEIARLRACVNAADGDLSRVLHEMAGAVSLCWTPKPTGVFDSTQACEFVAAAIAEIRATLRAKGE